MINSLASESKVLGAIINNIDLIIEFPELNVKHFSINANRQIYSLLKGMYRDNIRNFDMLDIYARSEVFKGCREAIDEYGGLDYLNTLQDLSTDDEIDVIKMHIKSVIDSSFKNDMIINLDKVCAKIEDNTSLDSSAVDALIDSSLADVRSKYSAVNQVKRLGDTIDNLWEQIETERQDGYSGIPTFSPLLNKFFTYLRGELYVVGARAKAGKSMYVINEVYNLSILNNVPIAIFDTELPTKTFLVRLLARVSNVNINEIMYGTYLDDERKVKLIESAKDIISNAPIFHHYDPYWTKESVTSRAKKLRIQEKVEIIIYDYIKAPEVVAGGVAEHSELGNWTIHLKNLSGELNIPIVALAQMSPYMDGGLRLADSRKIERYASTIFYLVKKSKQQYERDMMEMGGNYYIYVAFNRNGAQMEEDAQDRGVNIDFQHKYCKIEESQWQSINPPEN